MDWCGGWMMGLWAEGRSEWRPTAGASVVPRLTTPSWRPHIIPWKKNSELKQNISWFGLSFVQISCRKIRSFPFLIDFHSFLPKKARKYHSLPKETYLENKKKVVCKLTSAWHFVARVTWRVSLTITTPEPAGTRLNVRAKCFTDLLVLLKKGRHLNMQFLSFTR